MALAYRPDIDGLRALAVLPVVLYHADVPGFPGGFVGVDVFFVISGYLITSILAAEIREGRFSIMGFYERRVRRLMPALLAVTGATSVAAVALMVPPDLSAYAQSLAGALLFAANFVFAADVGYFAAPAETKPLLHTWSLAIEEQFYIAFPLLLLALYRRLPGRLTTVLAGLAAASLGAALWATAADPARAFFMPHLRAWELLLGAVLALGTVPAWRDPRLAAIAGWAGIAAILGPVLLYSAQTPFPAPGALLPCLGAALVIHAGLPAAHPWAPSRLLSLRPAVFTGLISYSLYLWHWPLIVFAKYVAMRPLAGAETAALLAVALILSILSWRYVERPFRRPGRVARRPLFIGAASGAAALLGAAALFDLTQGLPARFSPQIVALVSAKQEMRDAYAHCTALNRQIARLPEGAELAPHACRIGDPEAAPDFLLWGDSHAGVLVHGIEAAARRAGRAGWMLAHGGCPPLLGVEIPGKRASHRCAEFNAQVARFILAERPAQVILAGRWGLAATGLRYPGEPGAPMPLLEAGRVDNDAAFAEGLARNLAAIADAGAEAVVVGPVPELGFDPPARLARALRFGATPPEGPSRAAFESRQTRVLSLLLRLAERPGVTLVWPHEALCGPLRCAIAQDGRTLYFDDDHLSLFGSETVSPLFDPVMRR